jgi:nicotinate-nucleotide adenylyltransferase
MTIALFGGTFNPPHNGHLAAGLLVRELFAVDKIILTVSKNPLKSPAEISDAHRRKLTELLADELNATGPIFEVSSLELGKEKSYTLNTLQDFKSQFPAAAFFLVIGEDNFRNFDKWKSPEKILSLASLIVLGRGTEVNESFTAPPDANIIRVAFDIDLSSTDIRAALQNGQSVTGKMPQSISNYIAANQLFR